MELIIAILVVLGVIALGFFLLLIYSGFFYTYSIRCTVPASMPKRFAYKLHIGPYENIGPVFCKLSDLVPTKSLFSVYYDNPETTSKDQLRSIVGCYLPEEGDDNVVHLLESNGCKIWSFPECKKAIVTEFPYRNSLSIWIAVRRVYPSLMQYIKEFNLKPGPFLEICKKDAIQFVVVLEPIEGFCVPDVEDNAPTTEAPLASESGESKKTL